MEKKGLKEGKPLKKKAIGIKLDISLCAISKKDCNNDVWLTVVEGDPKAPFSIATTLRCRGGHYSFLWIAPLTLNLYIIMLRVKQGGIKYHFLSLWYDSTWNWTQVSWTIGKHSNHYANRQVIIIIDLNMVIITMITFSVTLLSFKIYC